MGSRSNSGNIFKQMAEDMARPSLSSLGDKSFKAAIEVLLARRRPQRPTVAPIRGGLTSNIPETHGKAQVKGVAPRVGMEGWLKRIGHSTSDLDQLNIIHVAGTKGKGSTCAFAESFLRAYGDRTGFPARTGLYTSPHLISYEERIRINTRPISRELFAKYFFEVWDSLLATDGEHNHLPRYLQLMALVGMHAFIREGVQAAVFETHHGGEYDATNVIPRPIATVVTTLGMDHVKQLGPTIGNIAWHKAGIFKEGALAVAAKQEEIPAQVLRERAEEKGVELVVVDEHPDIKSLPRLKPDVQRLNCSVALTAAKEVVRRKAPEGAGPILLEDVRKGVKQFSWAGRFQTIEEGKLTWYLDGAHNELSIVKSADWFMERSAASITSGTSFPRIVIFNQISNERDGIEVLDCLTKALKDCPIDYVLFTDYDKWQDFDGFIPDSQPKIDGSTREKMAEIWRQAHPHTEIILEPSIQNALSTARKLGFEKGGAQTLVTGSLHLVGGAIFHLQRQMAGEQ